MRKRETNNARVAIGRWLLRLPCLFVLTVLMHLGGNAQGAVHWQTVLNDTLLLHLNVSYTAPPRQLKVDGAYIVRKGQLRRMPMKTEKLTYKFIDEKAPAFTFSVDFRFGDVRYRVHGRHTEQGESALRCVPLRLSKETLREGEYM